MTRGPPHSNGSSVGVGVRVGVGVCVAVNVGVTEAVGVAVDGLSPLVAPQPGMSSRRRE